MYLVKTPPTCLSLQTSKNDFRRKWDKEEYENLAQKRLAEERDRERRDGEEMNVCLFFRADLEN